MGSSIRLAYIDGLRAVAVLLVLIGHCVIAAGMWATLKDSSIGQRAFFYVANDGGEGVSLFLVLSGFCLSFPALLRFKDGRPDWFKPSEFFARRCLRILPPYYGALLWVVGLQFVRNHWASRLAFIGKASPLRAGDVLTHVLLVHNMTPGWRTVSPPFWSLGLEWQWYFVFPVALLLGVYRVRLMLAVSLVIGLVWVGIASRVLAPDNTGAIYHSSVPPRLFEFCCGIAVAYLVVHDIAPRRRWAWVLLGAISAAAFVMGMGQQAFPLWIKSFQYPPPVDHIVSGIGFGLLVLLGYHGKRLNRILSFRPLTAIGFFSYSVYLMHYPIVALVLDHSMKYLRYWPLGIVVGVTVGLVTGYIFHRLIERPCMERATWVRVAPYLRPLFTWTDRLPVPAPAARTRPATETAARVG